MAENDVSFDSNSEMKDESGSGSVGGNKERKLTGMDPYRIAVRGNNKAE